MTACGKKAYASWAHASNDAKSMRRKDDVPRSVYRCRHCQSWHVGNQQIERSARREERHAEARLD